MEYLDYEGLREFKNLLDDTFAKKGEDKISIDVTGTPASSKTVTSLTRSGNTIYTTFGNISISTSQVNGLDTALNGKVNTVSGKGLSTNDFTTELKNKLDNIEAGATANLGTVTGISVNRSNYEPVNGLIMLPDYPTTLPASDVSSWAKANSKPTYNLDEVSDGTTRKIPTKTSQLSNDSGFITSHQSLSGYATENWVSNKLDDILGIDASGVSALTTALSDNDTATGILKAISNKVDKESGKRLMTDAEGTKLSGIESGAQAHKAPTSSEITTALGYTPYNSSNPNGYTSNIGTVTGVKIGSSGTTINPSSGIITIPAYESGAQVHKAPTAAEVKSALGTGSGTIKYLREDGTWLAPPNDNTIYAEATTSAAGLMSAEDKTKLNGIAAGATANVGTITGIKMNGASKGTSGVVDLGTVITSHQDISGKADRSATVSNIVYDTTNKKITKTINGTTSDVVTVSTIKTDLGLTKSDVGLGNVGNFKAVSTAASQGLSTTEQSNARANIGAGTSSFSGSYNDLTNKPTIPSAAANGTFSVKTKVGSNNTVTAADFTANLSSADDVTFIQGTNVTLTTDTTNRTITVAATDTTYSAATTSAAGLMSATDKSKLDGIASGATANTGTITGIKMNGASKGTSGVVDLGTVITAHQDISGKVNTSTTVNGHVLTGNVTVTKSDVGLSNVTNDSQVKRSEMGAASGVATLDSSGKVPSSQLPSYVDDVIEAYYKAADGKFYTTLSSGTYSGAITGETGKIYVDLSTSRTYRWGGSAYTEIKASPGTLDDITDGSTYVRMTSTERTKLSGIATGATANTGTITKVGNTSSGAVTVSSNNNTASFGNVVTVGSVGGVDLKFTMPGNPNTNTWRPIQVGGTDKLTDSSTKLNFAGSGATSVSYSNGTITISSTDNNTVTSINGKTGAIAPADIATVLTGAGYKLTDTDTNTWKAATTSQEGYVPTLALSGTSSGAKKDTINTQANDYVLTYTSGTETAPVWRKLPANAYANSTYTVNNGTFTVKGAGTAVSSTSANASGNTAVDFVAGSNVTITPDATNGKITIASTDTNTWRPVGTGATDAAAGNHTHTASLASDTGTSAITLTHGGKYKLTAGGQSVIFTMPSDNNTTYAAGTGVTISGTNNAINVTYGTAANTACQGNDSRLSDSRPASDVYSWAKASNKPSYAYSEIGYTVNATSSAGGTLSLNGTTPIHVVTLTGNVSALTLSANPAEGHSCHIIFTSTAARTVSIAHDSTNRVCPEASDVTLNVPANGYVEINFLTANSKVYVRGI